MFLKQTVFENRGKALKSFKNFKIPTEVSLFDNVAGTQIYIILYTSV